MNAIALNFEDYIPQSWWNLDFEQGINFYNSPSIWQHLNQFGDRTIRRILKSHHPFEFFQDFITEMLAEFHIFYIYRDPRDVMVSYWQMLNSVPWEEGPKTATAGEFIRCSPMGAMMRYQKHQESTVLHRWQNHVEGWINFARTHPREPITLVRFEHLNENFEATINVIAQALSQSSDTDLQPSLPSPQRPLNEGDTTLGTGSSGRYKQYLKPEDCVYLERILGKTMQTLNYPLLRPAANRGRSRTIRLS